MGTHTHTHTHTVLGGATCSVLERVISPTWCDWVGESGREGWKEQEREEKGNQGQEQEEEEEGGPQHTFMCVDQGSPLLKNGSGSLYLRCNGMSLHVCVHVKPHHSPALLPCSTPSPPPPPPPHQSGFGSPSFGGNTNPCSSRIDLMLSFRLLYLLCTGSMNLFVALALALSSLQAVRILW